MRISQLAIAGIVALAVAAAGCSDSETAGDCEGDTDCPEGYTCLEQTCTAQTTPGDRDAGGNDVEGEPDADEEPDATAASCDEFLSSEEPGESVTFSVQHVGSERLYFSPGFTSIPISLSKQGEEDGLSWTISSLCFPTTCDEFLENDDCYVGCADVEPPYLAVLEPGDERTRTWDGAIYESLEMTSECFPHESCTSTCKQRQLAEPGTYEITLTGYETCEGDCECEGGGVCDEVYDWPDLTDPVTFTVEFEVPGTTTVELVVDH